MIRLSPGSVVLVPEGSRVEVRSGRLEAGAGQTALADLRVERALRAMRADLSRSWTVAELAEVAGLSRTAFARAFSRVTGQSPRAHLTQLRLERSAELLQDLGTGLAEVAAQVGYANEFSLSRAFKRHFGVAPAFFRKSLVGGRDSIRCAA